MNINTKFKVALAFFTPEITFGAVLFLALLGFILFLVYKAHHPEEVAKTPHYVYRLVLVGESSEPVPRKTERGWFSKRAADDSVVDVTVLYDGTFVTPKLLKDADNKK